MSPASADFHSRIPKHARAGASLYASKMPTTPAQVSPKTLWSYFIFTPCRFWEFSHASKLDVAAHIYHIRHYLFIIVIQKYLQEYIIAAQYFTTYRRCKSQWSPRNYSKKSITWDDVALLVAFRYWQAYWVALIWWFRLMIYGDASATRETIRIILNRKTLNAYWLPACALQWLIDICRYKIDLMLNDTKIFSWIQGHYMDYDELDWCDHHRYLMIRWSARRYFKPRRKIRRRKITATLWELRLMNNEYINNNAPPRCTKLPSFLAMPYTRC